MRKLRNRGKITLGRKTARLLVETAALLAAFFLMGLLPDGNARTWIRAACLVLMTILLIRVSRNLRKNGNAGTQGYVPVPESDTCGNVPSCHGCPDAAVTPDGTEYCTVAGKRTSLVLLCPTRDRMPESGTEKRGGKI